MLIIIDIPEKIIVIIIKNQAYLVIKRKPWRSAWVLPRRLFTKNVITEKSFYKYLISIL